MRQFTEIKSIVAIEEFIQTNTLAFIYISRPDCSVCHSLMPQVQELMIQYPEIKIAYINAAELEAVAGRFSIFTVPVLLLFVEGKEYVREARIVHMDLFEEKIDKIYKNVVGLL